MIVFQKPGFEGDKKNSFESMRPQFIIRAVPEWWKDLDKNIAQSFYDTLGGLIKLLHHIIDEHFAIIFFRHLGIFATATPFNVLAKDPSLQAPVS